MDTDFEKCSTRKLLFLCNKNNIPVSLYPTRNELLGALRSFFHVKSPEKNPSMSQITNNSFKTPKPAGGQLVPTPLIVHKSPRSTNQRQKSPTPKSESPIEDENNSHRIALIVLLFSVMLIMIVLI